MLPCLGGGSKGKVKKLIKTRLGVFFLYEYSKGIEHYITIVKLEWYYPIK